MTYVRVADPLLNSGKPGRSTDWKRIRDNQDDFDSRIMALEDPSIRVFSHFARRIGYTSALANFDDLILDGTTHETFYEGNNFYMTDNGSAGAPLFTNMMGQSPTSDQHFVRMSDCNLGGFIIATSSFLFSRTGAPPIEYIARIRASSNNEFFHFGFVNWTTGATLTSPAASLPTVPYIIMNRNNATDMWRFSCFNGTSTTHGSDFAKVVANTWFEVKITFTNNPSNQALCYLDSVLKSTLSTNLPTASILYGFVAQTCTGDTVDLDRMEVSASGVLSDAA